MRAESFTGWAKMTTIPEAALTARPRRQRTGVIKVMTPAPPPDEKTIRRLNALASRQPFCRLHRVKRHDCL